LQPAGLSGISHLQRRDVRLPGDLVVASFGFLMWFRVLAIYPASDMASFGFLTPLFGVAFGWLILDEVITWDFAGALALVCAGIVLVNRKRKVKVAAESLG
jgi:drug/metabolite transporter (DMT)-like permease